MDKYLWILRHGVHLVLFRSASFFLLKIVPLGRAGRSWFKLLEYQWQNTMLFPRSLPLAASLALLCLGNLVDAAPKAPPKPHTTPAPSHTVTIASGVVVGKSTKVTSGTSSTGTAVNYLGIPFAAPPTGTLRFLPPATPTAWKQPLQATTFPPACRQEFSNNATKYIFDNPLHAYPPESEDCLYLNIYAPTSACATDLKPVMFWIYGVSYAELIMHPRAA